MGDPSTGATKGIKGAHIVFEPIPGAPSLELPGPGQEVITQLRGPSPAPTPQVLRETLTVPILLLLTLVIGVPLIELYLLIEVGSEIGAFATIVLTLLTAVIGTWLVRWQGLGVLARVGRSMAEDEVPALELMDGALILVAGLFLLLPGFLTDALGFLLLVPPVRQALIRRYVRFLPLHSVHGEARRAHPRVIEGRFRRED